MASVAIAAVGVAMVVATAVAVATVLLLSAAVSVVVKMDIIQTAPADSSRTARRLWSSARLAQKFETLGLFVARLSASIAASLKSRRRCHS